MIARVSLLTALGLMLSTADTFARDWYIEPLVSVSAGFNDNPRLQAPVDPDANQAGVQTDIIEDQTIGILGGQLRFASESDADLFAVDLNLSARKYTDSELDSELIQAAVLYEKSGVNHDYDLELGYQQDSTVETEVLDTGNLENNVDRNILYFRPGLTSRFSDKWDGTFDLGYSDITFDAVDGTEDDTFTEYEELTGSARLTRVMSERFSLTGATSFIQFRPTENVDIGAIDKEDFVSVLLGLEYNLSERFLFTAAVGTGFTDTYILTEEGSEHSSANDPDYNVGIEYAGLRNTVGLALAQTFQSSSDGGLSQTQTATVTFSRPETLGGNFGLQLSYLKREPVQGDTLERDFISISPSMEWQMNESLFIFLNAEYREQDVTNTAPVLETNADSSAITLGARYDFGRKRL